MSYPVLWSLAVEEHFYLIWPTAVHRISERKLIAVAGGVILLAPVFRAICHLHAAKTNFVGAGCGYYTWNAADGLALGALFSLAVREFHSNRERVLQMAAGCLVAAVLLTAVGYPFGITTRHTTLGEALQVTPWNLAFTALLGAFLLIGTSSWKALVTPEILLFFGRISYGLLVSPAGFPCLRSARGTLRVAIPCELEQLGKPLVAICDCRVGSHWHFLFI